MKISIIAAISQNYVIGANNTLLWHLSGDLKRFKELTSGNSVLMGKRTYDSLPHKPLPNRTNIVLTHQQVQLDGCMVIHSKEELFSLPIEGELFVIGGASIYEQFMPYADRLYVTWIWRDYEGDATFPKIDEHIWKISSKTSEIVDEQSGLSYSYWLYEKRH